MQRMLQRSWHTISKRWLCFFMFFAITQQGFAQPANDNCQSASVITVSNNGFGKGLFTSSINDISQASLQTGETFAPAILVAGQNKKSMWYRFTLPTTRAVRVTLAQPGTTVTAGDAGFAVYKINTCLPINANISTKLTPIGTFGNTYHPCVDSGQYLIQVSSNNNANGPLFIELRVSDTTGALYDRPEQAYNFGVVAPHSKFVDYLISCQSKEDASERCNVLYNASQYHKSSWHTFTTAAYFDYLAILLTSTNGSYYVNSNTNFKFGYTLYKGNATTTPLSSLVTVDGCDSLLTNGYIAGYKMYKCGDLEPNTTYTIQLFAHETFNNDIRLSMAIGGTEPTKAPQPVSTNFSATNNFGTLITSPSAPTKTMTDFLACNSRVSATACNPSLPAQGVNFNSKKYNLSTFFTFTLNSTSSMNFYSGGSAPTTCGPQLLLRIFKQALTTNCAGLDTANLIGTYVNSADIDCLTPGSYVVQILGTDTTLANSVTQYDTRNNSPACLSSNLGNKIYLSLRSYSRQATSKFSLSQPGAFDTINRVNNVQVPLVNGNVYQMGIDTFSCANTVLPPDTTCHPVNKKVMYRQFIVADSGVARFSSLDWYYEYKLYKGDANALATSQNTHTHPSIINGLVAQTLCLNYTNSCTPKNVCITPGTYTFASFGNNADIGNTDRPYVGFNIVNTKHNTPALAQDMGSILDSVPVGGGSRTSDVDSFSCRDNAVTINGYTPCKINNIDATKAIYRQFYMKESALVSITSNNGCGFATGKRTLFSGKATDGLAGLIPMGGRWNCFNSSSYSGCDLLPAGWYTVVSYGSGPTFGNVMQNLNQDGMYGSSIGQRDQFTITVTVCASPKYNRPHKASVNNTTQQPHLIQWKTRAGSTAAYPRTDTTYTLPTEGFNCIDDIPFNLHPVIACDTTVKKVAYYVFKTTTETYLEINTSGFWSVVYALDVRTDSALLTSAIPIQPCVKGANKIQLCRLPAGTYTLIIFAPSTAACSGVTPRIYVDQIQESRFDHANKAYDFGIVPPDDSVYKGKVGEVNPVHPGRAGSSDFFSCITGSKPTDPTNARCVSDNIYNMYDPTKIYMYQGDIGSGPEIVRRNLWYTFVVDKPGMVYVKVENKTPSKFPPYRFVVFRSDVDGSLPFATVVSSGLVDSSLAQGLTVLGNNGWPNYCNALTDGVSFYRNPCTDFLPQRYYVLVENRNPYGYYNYDVMNPNNQLEVAIRIDSVNLILPKYDHYSTAYDFGNVGVGMHIGGTDNFSCASRNVKDPVSGNAGCTKTLWYKFTANITGNVRYRIIVNGVVEYASSDIQLFHQITPGDSTSAGLIYKSGANYTGPNNSRWTQHCVFPGTWYLILPGCGRVNENVVVEIELVEQEGDFCTRPVSVTMSSAGNTTANTIINCHTIGTDYGELNPTVTCPVGGLTQRYKSSWFRLDITSSDTLDVTTYISENTNVLPADIKYRMMTGNCNAMQEQSCVLDAQTQNTYKCLTAGSYYFQVFTPVNTTPTGTTSVTGDITLHLSSIAHVDTCAPINNCLANANFIPQFDCTKDTSVRFVNYSTFGSAIQYSWNFGFAGQTSSSTSPSFIYPALATSQTYQVTLKVNNTACNGKDSVTIPVTIPGRPNFSLGNDTSLCNGGSIALNATSWPGSTYLWNTNATTPSINVTGTGIRIFWARVTYNGCIKSDTIRVYVNTITPRNLSRYLCIDSVQLNSARNLQETHLWSTGETNASIYVSDTGRYFNTMQWFGCTIRDTFNVLNVRYPFVNDTNSVCFRQPYVLNATAPGASGYTWQNNSTQPTFSAAIAGKYWVRINYGNCTISDTIVLTTSQVLKDTISKNVCAGQSYSLPSGQQVNAAGTYRDTVRYRSGCDSLITIATISLATVTENITRISICAGESYTLPWGGIVNTGGTYSNVLKGESGCDSLKNTIILIVKERLQTNTAASICAGGSFTLPSGLVVNQPGSYSDTLRYEAGCDSLIYIVQLSVRTVINRTTAVTICAGQQYTLPSGIIVNVQGAYLDTVRYIAGCDSMVTTINLSVLQVLRSTISATICTGEAFTLPSGLVVTNTGTYSDTLRFTNGCDSLINTVNLLARTLIRNNSNPSICEGATFTLPSGVVVSNPGIYRDTIRYTAGCDSLINAITLSIKAVTRSSISRQICEGAFYTLPSGTIVNSAGMYRDTLKYVSGCDSVITNINLSIQIVSRATMSASICAGATYTLPSGMVITTSGTYRDTLRYFTGCDSLITTVNLLVKPLQRRSVNASICTGQSYTLPSGLNIITPGIYSDTLRYNTGCDSVIHTITLQVKTLYRNTANASICAGQSYTLPSGIAVNAAGTYLDTVRYISGCDSLISSTSISIKPTTRVSASGTICQGQSFTLPSGTVVQAAGIYNDTLRYASGCDSVIATIALAVKPIFRASMSAGICAGRPYLLPSGTAVFVTGIYNDTIRYRSGCDSLVTVVNLLVNSPATVSTAPSICTGENYTMPSGLVVNTAGTYIDVIKGTSGCDSIVTTIRLTVNTKPVINLTKSNDINCIVGTATLIASGGRTYQWWPPVGLTSTNGSVTIASPQTTTYYKVQATNTTGCSSIDSIQLFVDKGDANGGYLMPSAFTPNNDGKNDCFGIKTWGWVTGLNFMIFDRWGNTVFTSIDPSKCWDGRYQGQPLGTGAYVYYLTATTICGPITRKGTIVLIR